MASTQVLPTVSNIAGTEFVEIIPASNSGAGPTHVFATTNQIAFNQGSTVTATASSGAATANGYKVVITSESLTTAAGAVYTLTLTNSVIAATSILMVNVLQGTNTTLYPQEVIATPGSGSATIIVKNIHSSSALNGTIVIQVVVFN